MAPAALFSRPFSWLAALRELQKGALRDERLCQAVGAGAECGVQLHWCRGAAERGTVSCCCAGWAGAGVGVFVIVAMGAAGVFAGGLPPTGDSQFTSDASKGQAPGLCPWRI